MAIEKTSYEALEETKNKANKTFEEMLMIIKQIKDAVESMKASGIWDGNSYAHYNQKVQEAAASINSQRRRFNEALEKTISVWRSQQQEAEQTASATANTING